MGGKTGARAQHFLYLRPEPQGQGSFRSGRGQEKVGGTSVGFQVDPKLVSAGNGGTVGNAYNLGSMNAYQLQSTSPLRGKGLVFSTSTPFTSSLSTSTSPDVGAGLL